MSGAGIQFPMPLFNAFVQDLALLFVEKLCGVVVQGEVKLVQFFQAADDFDKFVSELRPGAAIEE